MLKNDNKITALTSAIGLHLEIQSYIKLHN